MGKKICFFDVDNTLAPYGIGMTQDVQNCLHQLKDNGHLIFVNSGRNEIMMPKYIRDFDFDGFIYGCGLRALLNGQVLYENKLDYQLQKEIVKDAINCHIDVVYEGETGVSFVHEGNDMIFQIIKDYTITGVPIFEMDENYEFVKCCMFTNDKTDMKTFMDKYGDRFEFILREDLKKPFYEVVTKGFSKGNAIHDVCKLLNVDIDDCYVFGDSGNDLSMLNAVKHSIAMGNASEEVKAQCEFITHDCKDDGIEYACKHYGLIK